MTDQEIIALIDNSIAEEFELKPDQLKPEAALYEDLGLDSLDRVDMVVILEKAFGFKVNDEDGIREIRTLGDIHSFVLKKRALLGDSAGPAPASAPPVVP